MGAWDLRKDAILLKGQTWAALRLMCEILTDFEPLELSLIGHKIHSKQNTAKIGLVLLFFLFSIAAFQPFGNSWKLNVLIAEIVVKFDIPNINSAKKVHKSQN